MLQQQHHHQHQPSPPLVDEELLQLQMVQSLIKEEPGSKMDLTQVILEAVAAAAASANAAVGAVGAPSLLGATRSKNFAEMFNCTNSAMDELAANASLEQQTFQAMLHTPYQQQLAQLQQQQLLLQQQQSGRQVVVKTEPNSEPSNSGKRAHVAARLQGIYYQFEDIIYRIFISS